MYKEKKKTFWESWGPWIVGAIVLYIISQCSSSSSTSSEVPAYLGNHTDESAEYQADMSEMETRDYQAEMYPDVELEPLSDPVDPYAAEAPLSGCPDGCTSHIDGCDIKGNIGFDSGKKIYHLPGQDYYNETDIDPSYGERWFCTESEATANGWRKSYQ